MKTQQIQFFFLKILLLTIVIGISCKEEDDCVLPDLTGEIIENGTSTQAGTGYDFNHEVKNLKDVYCTNRAKESNTRIQVDYSEDPNNNTFRNVFDEDNFEVPALDAGKVVREPYEIVFENPGTYIIITTADGRKAVSERREDNNQDKSNELEGRSGASIPMGLKITVLENFDYKSRHSDDSTIVRVIRKPLIFLK